MVICYSRKEMKNFSSNLEQSYGTDIFIDNASSFIPFLNLSNT